MTLIRMYWFFSVEVTETFDAIEPPSAGERSVVIVLSTQLPLTKSTLKLPAVVTAFHVQLERGLADVGATGN